MSTAVLPFYALRDPPSEVMGKKLHPVAYPEDRIPAVEDFRVHLWRILFVDAVRPAGEDNSFRTDIAQFIGADIVPDNGGEDIVFPDPASDKLAVLRAEIEYQDLFVISHTAPKEKKES